MQQSKVNYSDVIAARVRHILKNGFHFSASRIVKKVGKRSDTAISCIKWSCLGHAQKPSTRVPGVFSGFWMFHLSVYLAIIKSYDNCKTGISDNIYRRERIENVCQIAAALSKFAFMHPTLSYYHANFLVSLGKFIIKLCSCSAKCWKSI